MADNISGNKEQSIKEVDGLVKFITSFPDSSKNRVLFERIEWIILNTTDVNIFLKGLGALRDYGPKKEYDDAILKEFIDFFYSRAKHRNGNSGDCVIDYSI